MSVEAAHRIRHRTDVPGIFRRGTAFEVPVKKNGVQRWKRFKSMQQAIAFQEKRKANDPASVELLKLKRSARVRAKADLSDAYVHVRQALQSVDRAHLSVLPTRQIQTALHEAEDLLTEAMRRAA